MREGWKPSYPVLDAMQRSFGDERHATVVVAPGFVPAEAVNAKDQAFGPLHVSPALLRDPRIAILISELLRELSRARRKVSG
jgi:hypothetical protein